MPPLPRLGWDVGKQIRKVFVKERQSCSGDPQVMKIMWIRTTVRTLWECEGLRRCSVTDEMIRGCLFEPV